MLRGWIRATAVTIAMALMTSAANAQDGPAGRTIVSSDGLATLSIPDGALPPGVEVTLEARTAEQMPEELLEWFSPIAHYAIEPVDTVFTEPVTLTRRISLSTLDLEPLSYGIPLGTLVIADGDLEWSWLADARSGLDSDAAELVLGGTTDRGGWVFGLAQGQFMFHVDVDEWIGKELPSETTVGEHHVAVMSLWARDYSALTIEERAGSTAEPSVAMPAQASWIEQSGESEVSHDFECVGPGETTFEAPFMVRDFGADDPYSADLGLAGVDVLVSSSGVLICTD